MTVERPRGEGRVHRVEPREVDLPPEIPVLFLVSQVVFPFGASQIRVRTPRNLALLDALHDDEVFAVAFAPGLDAAAVKPEDLGHVGVAARVIARLKLPDGTEQVTLQGLQRVYIDRIVRDEPYMLGRAACVVESAGAPGEAERVILDILRMAEELAGLGTGVSAEHVAVLRSNLGDPGRFADLVAAMSGVDLVHQKRILEKTEVPARLEYVAALVREQLEFARVQHETDARVRQDIERTQREFYLRRQMKVLREELGETTREEEAAQQALARLAEAQLPPAADAAVRHEVERLRAAGPGSAESGVISNYLDWMLALPWSKSAPDRLDVDVVKAALDEDHYGLDEPKRRILEYIAVRQLRPDAPAPVLCFLGPPGTGKTSLAQSIARATGRPLARISVGGVRDEAAIRGHRRTYVGALPGRIVDALRKVGCNNPLLVIDELDKMGEGPQGDPAAALLEVLDPEQNAAFTDHYLDVPVDLSKVFFVATANDWFGIPGPLRDRMELIELSSYVEEEKVEIARHHLVPREQRRTGLPHAVAISPAALRAIIRGYTTEAGVRELTRRVQAVFRKLAYDVATGAPLPRRVGPADIPRLLGPPPVPEEARRRRDEVGVVNGLAWTSVGGDVLLVEGLRLPGEGGLQVTGSLGDVMRESIAAAHSFVRSRQLELQIPDEVFAGSDVHLHFPEGATPKDGPSAGVAVATALASLFTGRPVRADVAMTGEITLRGEVLPIGGLKEKLAAAARLGIRHVIVPAANAGEVERIRPEVRKRLVVHAVRSVDEVLALALRPPRRRARRPRPARS